MSLVVIINDYIADITTSLSKHIMKNSIKFLTVFMAIILLSSFNFKNSNGFIGTFGVSASDPSQIKLTINSDHTFSYQDFSVSNKKIVVNG